MPLGLLAPKNHCSGTCLIRHTKGPVKCVGLYRMSENSGVGLHKFHCSMPFGLLAPKYHYYVLWLACSQIPLLCPLACLLPNTLIMPFGLLAPKYPSYALWLACSQIPFLCPLACLFPNTLLMPFGLLAPKYHSYTLWSACSQRLLNYLAFQLC